MIKKKKESKILRLFKYLAKDVHYMASCLGGQEISAGQAIWQASEIPKESCYWLRKTIAHHKGFECKIKLQMSHDKNFIKTKSSLSVQKREKIKLCCSPQLKKKQPLFLIINTWVLCRAWWNDVKNTVVHCYSCQKALALTEFSRGICTWPHLALSRKQWSAKDFFKNWRGAIITHRSFAQSIRHYAAGVWG